jgi:transcriptional regulator with XRE-family HTH domain
MARQEAGLTQQQLAIRVGVAPFTIAHIETSTTKPTCLMQQRPSGEGGHVVPIYLENDCQLLPKQRCVSIL